MEADLVQRAGIPFTAIPAAGVHGVGLRTLPGNLLRLARGAREANRIVSRFQPDVLFLTGGFVGVPMALAARRIPTLLYVPDIEPGLALKALAGFADRIAVTTETSRAYFSKPERVTVTGYPTRPDLTGWQRQAGREKFGLSTNLPVVLVFGGSKGARSINRALLQILPGLLEIAQVLHITGRADWDEVQAARERLDERVASRYHAFDYLHNEMGAAFAAADLAVCRAGASSLGELPMFGLPSILVPYPYAWRYQKVNATFLARNGAAEVLVDSQITDQLAPTLKRTLADPKRLLSMRQAMLRLARPDAAAEIGRLVCELAGQPPSGGPRA